MEGPNKNRQTGVPRLPFAGFLVLSFLSLAFFCAGVVLPYLTVLMFCCSAPLAVLGLRGNKMLMSLGFLLVSFVLLLIGETSGHLLSYLFYFLLFGQGFLCFGLVLPLGRVERGSEVLFLCSLLSIVVQTALFAVCVCFTGQNPFAVDPELFRALSHQLYAELLSQGGQNASAFVESLEQTIAFMPYMVPSMIVMSAGLYSLVNYKVCEMVQRNHHVKLPALPYFSAWRFPQSLLWAMVFAMLMPLAAEDGGFVWTVVEANLRFIVNAFFFLQGISLVWWWLTRRRVWRALKIAAAALLVLPIFNIGAIVLGVADMCVNLRRFAKNDAGK